MYITHVHRGSTNDYIVYAKLDVRFKINTFIYMPTLFYYDRGPVYTQLPGIIRKQT